MDLVKCRGFARAKEEFDVLVENCLPFLEEEINILKPKLLVAVGNRVYGVLNERVKPLYPNLVIGKITHYSYAFRYDKQDRIENDFRRLRNLYDKIVGGIL
jgi:uracil-DNA glycosylase